MLHPQAAGQLTQAADLLPDHTGLSEKKQTTATLLSSTLHLLILRMWLTWQLMIVSTEAPLLTQTWWSSPNHWLMQLLVMQRKLLGRMAMHCKLLQQHPTRHNIVSSQEGCQRSDRDLLLLCQELHRGSMTILSMKGTLSLPTGNAAGGTWNLQICKPQQSCSLQGTIHMQSIARHSNK